MSAHILIVGGSSGIGLAAARRLLAQGCVVTLCARNPQKLEAAAASLGDSKRESVRVCVADGMNADQMRQAVAMACDANGQLQGAVAVPGGASFSGIAELQAEQLSAELAMNTVPLLNLIQAALPVMPTGGSIVAISSTAAVQTARGLAGYCAGKAALEALLRVAADELGERGVRLNALRPGLTRTEATRDMFASEAVIGKYLPQIPLGRVGEAEDIAGAIAFLLSAEASWITGQSFAADGGHVLRAFPDLSN